MDHEGGSLHRFVTTSKDLFAQKEAESQEQQKQSKAIYSQIEAVDAALLEAKQETLRATETIAKEEEDRAHDNFMLETQLSLIHI